MRTAALLGLLALIAPAIARVACDAGCVQAEHRTVEVASAASCHERQAAGRDDLVVTRTDDVCHGGHQAVVSSAASERQTFKAALAVRPPQPIDSRLGRDAFLFSSSSLAPPPIVLIATPLRI